MSVFYKDINVTVTVSNDKSSLDTPLIFYQGDFGLDINFKLISRPLKFKKDTINILNNYNGAYVDVTIIKVNGTEKKLKNLEIKNGDTVVFTITKEMTDFDNIGVSYLQFHIGNASDDDDTSYFSIPEFQFTVRKQLASSKTQNFAVIQDTNGNTLVDKDGVILGVNTDE